MKKMTLLKKSMLVTSICMAIPVAFAEEQTSTAISDEAKKDESMMTVWSSPVVATPDIISQETMIRFNKRNVAEALNTMPGVILQKSGNRNELQASIRGFSPRQVPVFLDGIPIYIPYDGNLDLGRFLTGDLAAIEVSKGYASLLQGPNMMGGAINLTTQRPQKNLESSLAFSQGWARESRSAYEVNGNVGVKNDWGYLQVSGNRLDRDFNGLPYGTRSGTVGENGKRSNSDSNDQRGTAKLGFTPNESDEYALTYINQQGDKSSPPYAGNNSNQRSRYWQWPEYDKESYYYHGITRLSDRMVLQTRAYHDTFKNTLMMYNSLSDLQQGKGNYSHYDDYSNGAGIQLAIDMRENDVLSFSSNLKDDTHREKGDRNAPYDRFQDRTTSVAAEYQWAILESTDVVLGTSYDKRTSREAFQYEKDGSITYYDDNDSDKVNWQTTIRHRFDNQDQLHFSFSQRSRFPTLKERYTTSKPATGQVAIVNPQLKAETAHITELRYIGKLGSNWSYDTSIYYNRLDDAIMAHNIDSNTLQNRNSGRIDYSGLDLGIEGHVSDNFSLGINYGYIHSDTKHSTVDHATEIPKHKVFAWLKYQPWEDLDVTLTQEARSWSYNMTGSDLHNSGFAKTGLRLDYPLLHGISVNASVDNLFDATYAYTEGFIEEGRNYWLGIAWHY